MIIIAGGGISGLSSAYFLQKMNIECIVLEQSAEPGGCIRSQVFENCLLEAGPNSLLSSPYLDAFIEELDLNEEILLSAALNKNRFIFKNGKYSKLPSGPLEFIFGNFFSFETKLRIVKELFRKPGASGKKELRSFFIDHFGLEIADYALNPFVSGIYAGDPERLLVSETFPSLLKFEEESGSLLRGMIKNASARRKLISFKKGMQTLPERLAEKIKIIYKSKVNSIKRSEKSITVKFNEDGREKNLEADGLILALPAFAIADIIKTEYPDFVSAFSSVNYPPMTVVHSAYKKSHVGHPLHGFGGLNPKIERKFSAGSIWSSSVFPSRCPEDITLFTTFVGGTQYEKEATMPVHEIYKRVHEELKNSFAIESEPIFQTYALWPRALPQYESSILEVKNAAAVLERERIYCCSNIFDGVSLEDCIRKGELVSKKIQNQIR